MKQKITYRKRRDLMLKNFSSQQIILILGEEILRSGLFLVSKLGRPCEIKKENMIDFILFSKIMTDVYEEMELNSDIQTNKKECKKKAECQSKVEKNLECKPFQIV